MRRTFRSYHFVLLTGAALFYAGILILGGLDVVQGNRPIRFHGRVIDQYGRGVQGVEISGEVTARKRLHLPVLWGPTGNVYKKISGVTDEGGL